MLLAALDQTIVSTALPTIIGDLGGASHLSRVVTAYLLASTASTPLWGKLGDRYGRKRFFQAAIVIFLVGSAPAGLSSSMVELILFSRRPGRRWRRADDRRPDHHWRCRVPTRAGTLPGDLRRGVRRHERDRPADRWPVRRPPVMAMGVLRQPASGSGGVGGHRCRPSCHPQPGASRHRLSRRGADRPWGATSLVLCTSLGGRGHRHHDRRPVPAPPSESTPESCRARRTCSCLGWASVA